MSAKQPSPRSWSRWFFYAPPALRDAISCLCFDHGANGLIEHPEGMEAFFQPSKSIHEIEAAYTDLMASLRSRGFDVQLPKPEISAVHEQDWNREWKKEWRTISVTERIWIRPSWLPAPLPTPDCLLEIDPEMAFGTGTHATTRLTLMRLEESIAGGESVLDVGTGTGILAIAAIKLGAAYCIALDVDPIAVETAQRNAYKNDVADHIAFYTGTVDALLPRCFDRIVANIQRSVLLPMLVELENRLSCGGQLILSGLLVEEENEIHRELEKLHLLDWLTVAEGEWIAIHCRKADSVVS